MCVHTNLYGHAEYELNQPAHIEGYEFYESTVGKSQFSLLCALGGETLFMNSSCTLVLSLDKQLMLRTTCDDAIIMSELQLLRFIKPHANFALIVCRQVFLDQTLFGAFITVVLFIVTTLMEGKTMQVAQAKIQASAFPTMVSSWYVWPWVQLFNMGIVPAQYQILVINAVSIPWCVSVGVNLCICWHEFLLPCAKP